MTPERDVERLLDSWFSEGPREAPDRVLETVAGRIHRRRQRPAWLLDRRPPAMNGPIRLFAIAAVLVGAFAIGTILLSGSGQPVEVATPPPSAQAEAPATPAASTAPDATPRTFSSFAVLAAGPYVAPIGSGSLAFTLPVGWGSPGQSPNDFSLRLTAGPADDIVNVWTDMYRAATNTDCTEGPEPGVGLASSEILTSLQADDQLSVSAPTPVVLPGATGVWVDVRVADGATRTCAFSNGGVTVPLVVDDLAGEGPFWGVGPGEQERLYLLDTAGGHNLVILADSAKGDSFATLTAAAAEVIATMAWEPGPNATYPCSDGGSINCAGPLPAGTVETRRFGPAFSIALPDGWANTFDIYRTYSLVPAPHVFDMQVFSHLAIPEQNADCTAARKEGAGNTVDDWVAFITGHPGLVANTPTAVTIGGHDGMRVQFHVDPAWTERCPKSVGPAVMLFTDDGKTPSRATWFDDQRVTAWILDVDGETVIIHVDSAPSSDANDAAVRTVQPILDTLSFTPAK